MSSKMSRSVKFVKKCFKGNYISNLRRHLTEMHNEIFRSEMKDEDEGHLPSKKIKFCVTMCENEVRDACVEIVTTEKLPLSFLDSKPFKTLTEPIFCGLKMNAVTSRNVIDLIKTKYDQKKMELMQKLDNEIICLKLDTASRLNRGILGVNIQLYKNSKLIIATLGLIELQNKHTGENLKTEVEKILEDFGINKKQIYSVTTDNGRNMIKTVELLNDNEEDNAIEDDIEDEDLIKNIKIHQISSIKCAAHTLQLAIKDFLSNVKYSSAIERVRKIVKILRTPSYRYTISAQGLPQPELDVPTRWNSTYKMLEKILRFQDFCDQHSHESFKLLQKEWAEITDLVAVMKPAYVATMKLQSEQLYLGDFCKLWLELKLSVESTPNENSGLLLRCLQNRESKIMDNETILAALYLDPRIRRILIKNPIKLMYAKSHLKQLLRQVYSTKKPITATTMQDDDEPCTSAQALLSSQSQHAKYVDEASQGTSSLLGQYLSGIEVSTSDEESDNDTDDKELQKGVFEIENFNPKPINVDIDIMAYWQRKKYRYPQLYKLAKIIHSVPATQVSVERSFSALRLVLNDLRSNLSADTLEKIMFLKVN